MEHYAQLVWGEILWHGGEPAMLTTEEALSWLPAACLGVREEPPTYVDRYAFAQAWEALRGAILQEREMGGE